MRPLTKGYVVLLNRKINEEPTLLDQVINQELNRLLDYDYDADEYATILDHIAKLNKFKEQNALKRISPDTVAIIAGNLAGIIMILAYERAHIVTSKALGFVLKAK